MPGKAASAHLYEEPAAPAELPGKPTIALFRYIAATSWRHQLGLVGLSVLVFLLEVVPLEIQRRVVNDVVKHRPYTAILWLCAGYIGAVIVQGGTKLGLNIYRSWVGERAKRDLRGRIWNGAAGPSAAAAQGTAVSMIVAEVEPIGGFVGSSVSEPLLQAGVLATVIAYIIHLDVWMGAAALALFAPQLIFVPLIQHAINRRTGARVWLLRQLGGGIIGHVAGDGEDDASQTRIDRVFAIDMRIFELKFSMNFLMNLCSHLQVVAALALGGWWVLHSQLEVGGIVAFISAVGRLNDPWGDLVNYFRELTMTAVKFGMLTAALRPAESGDDGETKIATR